ncbi:tautomerase family protein [Phenylobacterium sp.]|uniref:tautomerase family protein n=1 Tax=Phenylobacterium sp. TaxID=1871053 RepID=UPI002ED91962
MPLWKVYHPVGAYTRDEKQAFSAAVTEIYGRIMPKFYVGVVFQEVDEDSFFIGGEARSNFVRIWIDHIARAFPSTDAAVRFVDIANKVIAPWVKDRGLDWEFHIDETPFEYWSIQGHFPPKQGTEDEQRWMTENRPSPRTHA